MATSARMWQFAQDLVGCTGRCMRSDPSADPRICYARVFESKNGASVIFLKNITHKKPPVQMICMTNANPRKNHDKSWLRNLTTHYRSHLLFVSWTRSFWPLEHSFPSAQSGFHGFSLITNRYVGCKYIRSERKLINQQRSIRFMFIIWLYALYSISIKWFIMKKNAIYKLYRHNFLVKAPLNDVFP